MLAVDDDPTGSQVVRDLIVHFGEAGTSSLTFRPGDTEFLLTNTRSLDAGVARGINQRVGRLVAEHGADPPVILVSRSDSTLRGHIREEVSGLVEGLRDGGFRGAVRRIFCPAYIAAGRITQDDVQLCVTDGELTPVAQTPFASDPTFAFTSSDLRSFLAERRLVRSATEVMSISLDMVRDAGAEAIHQVVQDAGDRWVVANATEERDLDVIAQALIAVSGSGIIPVIRGGPSIVRALAGQPVPVRLTAREIAAAFGPRPGHGLIVVGSHVPLATAQLADLLVQPQVVGVEIEARRALTADPDHLRTVIARATSALHHADVVLWTSRELADDGDGLSAARRISGFIVDAVRRIVDSQVPAWLIAKGGITAHEVAASAVGVRSARIIGQVLDGQVSLASAVDAPEPLERLPYVIFAGNVGVPSSLTEVRRVLMRAFGPGASASSPTTPRERA